MTSNSNNFNRKPDVSGPRPTLDQSDYGVYIEKERILYTLEKALYKIEVAVCLPLLIANDCELLRPLLTDNELSLIFKSTLWRFSNQLKRDSTQNIGLSQTTRNSVQKVSFNEQSDKLMEGFGSFVRSTERSPGLGSNTSTGSKYPGDREDPAVSRVIHMLCSKPRRRLRQVIKEKIVGISVGSINFLRNLYQLRNLMETRMNTSQSTLRRRDRVLRFAWRRNEKAKLYIVKLKNKLEIQTKQGINLLKSKDKRITEQQTNLGRQARSCKLDIKNIITASESEMVLQCGNYESELNKLALEVKGGNLKHATLLQEHLRMEKYLRDKRLRVEGQLSSWVDKYDQDVREKQAELDDVRAGFNAEVEDFFILKQEFDIQEEDYNKLMAEKEAEYQRELEEKMYKFVCNRAARQIQRYWRAYRERKLARKKRHKGKKGKGSGKTK